MIQDYDNFALKSALSLLRLVASINLLNGCSEQYSQVVFVTLLSLCSNKKSEANGHFLKVLTLTVSVPIYMLELFYHSKHSLHRYKLFVIKQHFVFVGYRSSHQRCSEKKLFLKFCQYYRKKPVLESLFNRVLLKWESNAGAFLWNLRNF